MRWTETLKRALPWKKSEQPAIVYSGDTVEPVSDEHWLTPPVNLYENDKEIRVDVDVPGAVADNTTVHFDDHILQLTARMGPFPEGRALGAGELDCGTWYRRFQLPSYADCQRATSTLKHGVLSIHVPKSKAPRAHDIPVKAA